MPPKKKKVEGDPAKGEKIFKSLCAVCHNMSAHGTGPMLVDVYGSLPGQKEGFAYSSTLKGLGDKKWNDGNLDKYLKSPADYAPGNNMAFAGIANGKDRGDVIAYLKKNSKATEE
jgi:cytochrome c